MSGDGSNQISIPINQKLAGLSKTKSNNQFIFRIHQTLRRENEVAYEPEMLSIGPYNHGKDNLRKMEKYKLKYLQEILERRGESSVERYVAALIEVEEEARNYYGEQINLSPVDFVEMMLLDGCFIVEFLRKYHVDEKNRNGDPLFTIWSQEILCRDLLLFENQLPFFVLLKLFEMTKFPDKEEDLIHLTISCLNHCIAPHYNPPESAYTKIDCKNVSHLLGLIYDWWCSPLLEAADAEDQSRSPNQNRCGFPVFPVGRNVEQEEDLMDRELEFIKSVVELKKDGIEFKKAEIGIEFKKTETSKSWLDIRFNINSGIIEIPSFLVHHSTESVLRNLIAYEEYMFDLGRSGKFVTDYATFVDCLINTSKDVTMLRHERIIKNWLGDDEAVAKMFNKIRNNVFLVPPTFTYGEIFKKVNKHCSRKRHKYMANLRKKYFSNPWSIISLLAATVLLLLTLTQTIFAALQLWK